MAINLDEAQAGKPRRNKSTGAIAKTPAIGALQTQLETQGSQLETAARQAVQQWKEETKERLRGAVVDELAEVAADDFFGFASLFEEAGAIDVPALIV